jgi:L-ascorbate metabolism protein UlaG (beta-lactamase superfamily)
MAFNYHSRHGSWHKIVPRDKKRKTDARKQEEKMSNLLIALSLGLMFCSASFATDQYRGPNTAIEETSAGPLAITPIYHASVMFEWNGKVVHIDPWSRGDYSDKPKADLILITHQHPDHLDIPLIEKLLKPGTILLVTSKVAEQLAQHEWAAQPNYTVMANGDTGEFLGIGVKAVPAYNIVHERAPGVKFHPKGEGNGYVLTFGNKTVYIAGDTEFIPEMKELKGIDIAFLPCNLPYTMDLDEVVRAVRAIKPHIFYPYHYSQTDVSKLPGMLADVPEIKVRVVKIY